MTSSLAGKTATGGRLDAAAAVGAGSGAAPRVTVAGGQTGAPRVEGSNVVGGGKSLGQVVTERVTSKLGMADTGFQIADRARLAVPYADGAPPVPMGETYTVPFAELSGREDFSFEEGGGIVWGLE